MSAPRPVIPGRTYLLSRRCLGRMFLLRPSERINQIFEFCLAVAAARSGVLVHAYCVLSNHYHIVATDPEGRLPVFMHWLNEYVAKCVNAELGRWESFWAPGSYSAVSLSDLEDVMNALVYTYTNPVHAGLVRTVTDWPGARSLPHEMGQSAKTILRPKGFFRVNGRVPATTILVLASPPGWLDKDADHQRDLCARVWRREAELCGQMRRKGRAFLGRKRVLAQRPTDCPGSFEPRRGLNPRVAAKDKWRRVEVLGRLKGFLQAYRRAWARFAAGERLVEFPYGTYWMRVRFGVNCLGP
jgi:REP element-mobilizing transposase RayT